MDNALKGLIKAIFILGILVLVFYVIGYNSWNKKGFDDNVDLSDYFEKPQIEEEKIDTELVQSLYDSINFKKINYNFGSEFQSVYYGKNENLVSKFSNTFIVYLGVINASSDRFSLNCNDSFKLSGSDVDLEIKKVFGNIKYKPSSFTTKNKALKVTYNEKNKTYTVVNSRCSGIEFGSNHIETQMVDFKVKGEYLEIYEIAYYVSYESNSDGSYTVNYHKGPYQNTSVLYRNEIKDTDKFEKYKYTFEKKDDSYILYKVERVSSS